MEEKMLLYTYRYMWTYYGDKDRVNVKIVTDTDRGHTAFERSIAADKKVEKFGREYVCEYDCARFGVFEDLTLIASESSNDKGGEKDETV